jgi:hypothetical protein
MGMGQWVSYREGGQPGIWTPGWKWVLLHGHGNGAVGKL